MTLANLLTDAIYKGTGAQQLLFERLSPAAKLLCLRYVRNNEDAEELMLDGFYKFFKSLFKFRYHDDAGVFAYVKKIMVNECLMHLRKRNVFNLAPENNFPEIPVDDDVFDTLEATEIYEQVLLLPVGYRTVFNLFVIEGYDHKEIARALAITESTSRSQLARARAMIQKTLILKGKIYEKRECR